MPIGQNEMCGMKLSVVGASPSRTTHWPRAADEQQKSRRKLRPQQGYTGIDRLQLELACGPVSHFLFALELPIERRFEDGFGFGRSGREFHAAA